jgi:hypothetical protein
VGIVIKRTINNKNPPTIRSLKLNLLANTVATRQPESKINMTAYSENRGIENLRKKEHTKNIWNHI